MDYCIIYFHETDELVLQNIGSSVVYIGSVSKAQLQQSSLNNNLSGWRNYLVNRKGVNVRDAELLTLAIGSGEVKPLITLKKYSEKWKCNLGIPNHFPANCIVKVNGVTQNSNNDEALYDAHAIITVMSGTEDASAKKVTICLSPPVFHVFLSTELNRLKCKFAVKDKKQILFTYSSELPYTESEIQIITTVFEYIDLARIRMSHRVSLENSLPEISDVEKNILKSLGCWKNDKLINDFHEKIGGAIYQALFNDRLKFLFKECFSSQISFCLEVHFSPAEKLALQYPWEMIHNGENFLLVTGQVNLTRVIDSGVLTDLGNIRKVNVLLVNPDPYKKLRNKRTIISAVLRKFKDQEMITLNKDSVTTWEIFRDKVLSVQHINLIHFDGHTHYAKECNNCFRLNRFDATVCSYCQADIFWILPTSFFEFDYKDHEPDWIKIDDLKSVLVARLQNKSLDPLKWMLFTSCDSARIRNRDFENIIAPSLILAGVSTVVAMQGKVLSSTLEVFVENVYNEMLKGKTLANAVGYTRIHMIRDKYLTAWFMPVVYNGYSS